MNDKHIIDLIDGQSFNALSVADRERIATHTANCADCRDAYVSAKATSLMLQARVVQVIEPSPFFATRVMAAVRELRSAPSLLDLLSPWKTARAFVISGAGAVLILAGLTFITPQPNPEIATAPADSYPTEGVVFIDDVSTMNEDVSAYQAMDVVLRPEETDASIQR
jgi:hypothetical protein